MSRVGTPYVAALDEGTGKVLWRTTLDHQAGSDVYASPVVFDGVLLEGVSGGSAELGDESDRYAFQGSLNFVETGTSPHSTKDVDHPGAVGQAEERLRRCGDLVDAGGRSRCEGGVRRRR